MGNQYLRRLSTACFLSVSLAVAGMTPAQAGDVYEIDQIMDLNALTPEDFYRFVPNYLWIEAGDVVRFVNTTGNHTVKSVEGIWPDGVEPVDVSNQDMTDIVLTEPGVYGFRCKVHSRHGMFALVVVDSPDANLAQVHFNKLNDRGKQVFEALFEKLEAERASRQN